MNNFYNGFIIEYYEDGFLITSTNWKTHDLTKKYGGNIFGLTDENIRLLIENEIYPMLIKEIRNKLGI